MKNLLVLFVVLLTFCECRKAGPTRADLIVGKWTRHVPFDIPPPKPGVLYGVFPVASDSMIASLLHQPDSLAYLFSKLNFIRGGGGSYTIDLWDSGHLIHTFSYPMKWSFVSNNTLSCTYFNTLNDSLKIEYFVYSFGLTRFILTEPSNGMPLGMWFERDNL